MVEPQRDHWFVDADSGLGLGVDEAERAVRSLAGALRARIPTTDTATTTSARGEEVGDEALVRVGVIARTSLEGALAILAVNEAGFVAVPVNWRWSASEAARALRGSRVSAVLYDAHCVRLAASVLEDLDACAGWRVRVESGASHRVALINASEGSWTPTGAVEPTSARAGSLAVSRAIVFTSGTTSRTPKAVSLSRVAFAAQANAKVAAVGYGPRDVHLHCAPLSHVSGLCALCTALHSKARRHIFLPAFVPEAFAAAARTHDATAVLAVPAMVAGLHAFLRNPSGANALPFAGVRLALLGGDAVDGPVAAMAAAVFPRARILATYGLTEACSSVCFRLVAIAGAAIPPPPVPRGGQWVGRVAPHVQVAVLPHPQADAGAGEIAVRGPSVCAGYVRLAGLPTPQKNEEGEGWHRTGDLGYLAQPSGLVVCGRLSDAVRSGGESVYPSDAERALLTHPAVAEACCFGAPHAALGAQLIALVVLDRTHTWRGPWLPSLAAGCAVSAAAGMRAGTVDGLALREHARGSGLAGFRAPRLVVATHEPLPRTALGKVRRTEVRRIVLQALALESKL